MLLMTVKPGLRVLVLDDERVRHDWFAAQARDLDWDMTHVWTAKEFCETFPLGSWDVVFLDHDLADLAKDGDWLGTIGPNGTVAARLIARMQTKPGHVHIHSWNPEGADNMEAILKDAGMSPSRAEYGNFRLVRRAA